MDNVWAPFFPIFSEKDLLKVDKILGLTFLQAKKDFEGFKTAFFHLLLLSFVADGLFTTPVCSPRRCRFVYLWQTNLKANVCRNSTFQVNTRKNATWRRRLTSRNLIPIFVSTSCEERHNKLFGYKLGESTENNKALLFFSGKEKIQTFSGSI